ncbi:hypothetical protein B0H19DRAFT_1075932 [Mycena capillaripes]|nr:hypothetical protein B0H19DRAFT_1075932 [Mycena capillaripes]
MAIEVKGIKKRSKFDSTMVRLSADLRPDCHDRVPIWDVMTVGTSIYFHDDCQFGEATLELGNWLLARSINTTTYGIMSSANSTRRRLAGSEAPEKADQLAMFGIESGTRPVPLSPSESHREDRQQWDSPAIDGLECDSHPANDGDSHKRNSWPSDGNTLGFTGHLAAAVSRIAVASAARVNCESYAFLSR